jgi:hypothetical protein
MARAINYGRLMQQALRQLIADVLSQVARHGLPGNHHFFIAFDTSHPGVDMSASLKARFPDEMTIVLQEWFTDLAVMKDRFTVTLNFGDVLETIVIPFEAIKTFVDPSVEFGLKFDAKEEDEKLIVVADEDDEDDAPPREGTVIPFHPSRKT